MGPYKRKRHQSSRSLHAQRKGHVRTRKATCEPGRALLPETNPAGPLTLDFQPPEGRNTFLLLKLPALPGPWHFLQRPHQMTVSCSGEPCQLGQDFLRVALLPEVPPSLSPFPGVTPASPSEGSPASSSPSPSAFPGIPKYTSCTSNAISVLFCFQRTQRKM